MATFIGKGKLFIGKGDDFAPVADVTDFSTDAHSDKAIAWPTKTDLSFSIEMEMTPDDRRNFLVWWLMLNALATASRILD